MDDPAVVCIVMAAGAGRRFGGGKLMSLFRGRTLIEHALDAVPADSCASVIVVAGDPRILAIAAEKGFTPVVNDRPEDGLSRTIRLGLEAAGDCGAAMFMAADQPLLRRQTAGRLIEASRAHPGSIIAPANGGVRGGPCVFPARYFPELMRLEGDRGGSAVIGRHPEALYTIEVPAEELLDADTRDELKKLEK